MYQMRIIGQVCICSLIAGVFASSNKRPLEEDSASGEVAKAPRTDAMFQAEFDSMVRGLRWNMDMSRYNRGVMNYRDLLEVRFDVIEESKLQVVYNIDGGGPFTDPDLIHLAHMNFLLQQRAANVGVAPRTIARGNPRPFNATVGLTFQAADIVNLSDGTVIASLQEKPGTCLDELKAIKGGKFTTREALTIGVLLVNTLKRLHLQARVVHGNVRPSRICKPNRLTTTLMLQNFENAFAIEPGTFDDEHVFETFRRLPAYKDHQFSSLREKANPGVTRAIDEIYSVFAIMTWATRKATSHPRAPARTASLAQWTEWSHNNLLALPQDNVPDLFRGEVTAILNRLKSTVMTPTEEPVNYDAIIADLKRLLEIYPTTAPVSSL